MAKGGANPSGMVNSMPQPDVMPRPTGGPMPVGGTRVGNQIVPNGYEIGGPNGDQVVPQGSVGGAVQPTDPNLSPMAQPSGNGIYGQSADLFNQAQAWNTAAAGTFAGGSQAGPIFNGMGNYQNAFDNQVVNNYGQDLYDQTQRQLTGVGAEANAAGAFGGSRHGLVEGQVYDASQRNFSDFSSNLRRQGFMDAGMFSNMDIQNQMQGQFGAAQGMLGAAGQMGDLSKTGFNMGSSIGQQQWQQGLMGQMMNQNLMDGSRGMINDYVDQPMSSTGFLSGLGAGSPLNNNTTTMNTSTPGMMDWLGMGSQLIPFI